MKIRLAYGKKNIELDLANEWDVTIIEPRFLSGLSSPEEAIQYALQAPIEAQSLNSLVSPRDNVGVVFSDITRPTPNHILLPVLLGELSFIPAKNITLFNSLGTHRLNTEAELRTMLGDSIVDKYRIVQNDAFDIDKHIYLGISKFGHEIWLNCELIECDLVILTGFIEPHFFAGFSGGGKAVMPGMAGIRTIMGNHEAKMIGDPQATWGITYGNPIWDEIREIALKATPNFLLNVTLNRNKEITGVFAGNMDAAHEAGCALARDASMIAVPHPYDIVITSNSGYPLDLNLYQCVKGMCAAAEVVREGGSIIIGADCWDGIPEHGLYGQLLSESNSPQDLLGKVHSPGFLKQDQWQAQIQAQILLRSEVYVHSDNLTDEQIEMALLQPCSSIEDTLHKLLQKFGPQARICVLPEGPQTVPFIQQ